MRKTPLAEREPYIAADAASLSTSTERMSEVLMPSISSMGMPSTTNSGFTPSAEKVEIPRTFTVDVSPG